MEGDIIDYVCPIKDLEKLTGVDFFYKLSELQRKNLEDVQLNFWFDIEESKSVRKIALVIGNSNYQHLSYLKNPVNDAALMKETFLKLDFDTILYELDLDFVGMKKIIKSFQNLNKNYDVGFIYYAGHGVQDSAGNDYLLPIDWNIEKAFKGNELNVEFLSKYFAVKDSSKTVLILDACRKSYQPYENFSSPNYKNEPVNVKIGFSTSNGHVAYDNSNLENRS